MLQQVTGNDEIPEQCEIFLNMVNRFVGLLGREASRASENNASEYPFVAMDLRQVFAQLSLVRRHIGMTDEAGPEAAAPALLDVGCGIGNVLLLAEQLGFSVYGIEKDPAPYRIAADLFGEERIGRHDIWGYDRYHHFEVIYYFRPFSEREPQLRFERMIEEKLKPGGILVANHKNSEAINADPRFVRLDPKLPVWQKIAAA